MSHKYAPASAWYSATAAREFGTTWWQTEDGREVEVVAVAKDFRWPDKVYVGEVTQFLRAGLEGKQWPTK